MSSSLPLSAQVFAILSALIEERTGLYYDVRELELFAERVSGRASERGFESLLDYYYYLRYDADADAELALLAEALVVNETYFFREVAPLEVLSNELLPRALARGVSPRIWCAACSTGEEPLTLAMLLDKAGILDRVTLVASDISARVLERARSGVYRGRSLRSLPPGVVGRWLEGDQNAVRVAPRLASAIEWRQANLMDDRELSQLGSFDVIICRNVLIYFRDQTIENVVERLWQRLNPEGLLVVGASESLLRFNLAFSCEEQRGAFFYRKQPK
ncbi:MAG TPA: protein-glutamate O-methyltransferase CheR [Polyangiaceae bacterium]|nr:protein-glutamate O-methyltransferase CheR [Polyangiaceae bacterium]